MSLGTPNVPVEDDGSVCDDDFDSDWEDIYHWLYRKRVMFLGKEIEAEMATQIISAMVYLSREDPKQNLHLFINSTGGSLVHGLAIHNTMQMVIPDVHTLCIGEAHSAASLILASGAKRKRRAYPHARVMMHQPWSARFKEKPILLRASAEEMDDFRKTVADIYIDHTGQPEAVIEEYLENDSYLSAEECKAINIIDGIVGGPSWLEDKEPVARENSKNQKNENSKTQKNENSKNQKKKIPKSRKRPEGGEL